MGLVLESYKAGRVGEVTGETMGYVTIASDSQRAEFPGNLTLWREYVRFLEASAARHRHGPSMLKPDELHVVHVQ